MLENARKTVRYKLMQVLGVGVSSGQIKQNVTVWL